MKRGSNILLANTKMMGDKPMQASPKSISTPKSLRIRLSTFANASPKKGVHFSESPHHHHHDNGKENCPLIERRKAVEEFYDGKIDEMKLYHVKRYFRSKLEKWKDQDLEELKVVCRICGQEIFAKQIKKHSYKCKLLAEQEANLDQLNKKLREIIVGVEKEKRNTNMTILMERKTLMNLKQKTLTEIKLSKEKRPDSRRECFSEEPPKSENQAKPVEILLNNVKIFHPPPKQETTLTPTTKVVRLSIFGSPLTPKPTSAPKEPDSASKNNPNPLTRYSIFKVSANNSPDKKKGTKAVGSPKCKGSPLRLGAKEKGKFSPYMTSILLPKSIHAPDKPKVIQNEPRKKIPQIKVVQSERIKFSLKNSPASTTTEKFFSSNKEIQKPTPLNRTATQETSRVSFRSSKGLFRITKTTLESPKIIVPQETKQNDSRERGSLEIKGGSIKIVESRIDDKKDLGNNKPPEVVKAIGGGLEVKAENIRIVEHKVDSQRGSLKRPETFGESIRILEHKVDSRRTSLKKPENIRSFHLALPGNSLSPDGRNSVDNSMNRRSAIRHNSATREIQHALTLNAVREKLKKINGMNNLIKSCETLINYASLIQNFDEFTTETRIAFQDAKKEVSNLLGQIKHNQNFHKLATKLWQVLTAKFEAIRTIQNAKNELKSIEQAIETETASPFPQIPELNAFPSATTMDQDSNASFNSIKSPTNAMKSAFAKGMTFTKRVKKIRPKSVILGPKGLKSTAFIRKFKGVLTKLRKLLRSKITNPKMILKKSKQYRKLIEEMISKGDSASFKRHSVHSKKSGTFKIVLDKSPEHSESSRHSASSDSESEKSSSSGSRSSRSDEDESASGATDKHTISDSQSDDDSEDDDDDGSDKSSSKMERMDTAYFSDNRENIRKYAKNVNRKLSSMIRIDDFIFERLLSKGAYGKVWLVKRKATGDYYAMKIINFCDAMNRNNIDSLKKEKKVFEIIEGDFVAKAIFTFVHKNYLCVVMEFIVGGDFGQLLEKCGIFDQDVARFYIAEVIIALNNLHQLGIVHRDLKPNNIMLDKSGHIKLTDFGLSEIGVKNQTKLKEGRKAGALLANSLKVSADEEEHKRRMSLSLLAIPKAADARLSRILKKPSIKLDEEIERIEPATPSQKVRIIGTPDYIAPEIIKGICYDDPCIDWWSVGVLLFEFLVGIPPFNDSDIDTVFQNIMHRRIPWSDLSIGYEEGEITPEAKDLIDKLLELDRTKRLGSKGVNEIKNHPFFKGLNWSNILQSQPPIIPDPVPGPQSPQHGVKKSQQFLSPFQDDTKDTKVNINEENFQFTRLDILHEENQRVVGDARLLTRKLSSRSRPGTIVRKWSIFK